MDERRKTRRYKGKLMIVIVYRDDSGHIVTEDSIFSDDIGTGGLRISCPTPLPKGKTLDLKVFLFCDPIHLPTQGKVAWSVKKQGLEVAVSNKKTKSEGGLYWAGIEFVDIDEFTRERIMRWIRKEFNVK